MMTPPGELKQKFPSCSRFSRSVVRHLFFFSSGMGQGYFSHLSAKAVRVSSEEYSKD